MCGRFAQYSSREEYLDALGVNRGDIPHDPLPLGRYNVAPGTNVLILNEREKTLHLDPVFWGYGPEWWHKPALINARSETAFSGRMFRPLIKHGRAVVPADGWFEWKKEGSRKQPFFICHRSRQPLFMAALGRAPFNTVQGQEGFVILTSSSDQGMVDIHDRRPVILTPAGARDWLDQDVSEEEAREVINRSAIPESEFTWHRVGNQVGSPHNQGAALIDEIGETR